ncbi:VIT1/CCC1 transporter family protein [Candidatus Woesearchaeota archaeon]|nr:VIT1/CCC1 transporter family protein [Candidatus Woesearchaeota archaeon]
MDKKKGAVFSRPKTAEKGDFLREAIFGLNDGLVSTLSLLAGLSGAVVSNWIIVISGLAEIVAGSISMGLGAYISMKSELEYYKNQVEKEKKAISIIPNIEVEEIMDVYIKKGFTKKEAMEIVNKIIKNKRSWLETLIHEKVGLGEINEDPKKMGLTNGLAFILGGIFPILPFIFLETTYPLLIGTFFALIILFIVGSIKSKYTGKNWFSSGLELSIITLIAATLSYFAGRLINILIGG